MMFLEGGGLRLALRPFRLLNVILAVTCRAAFTPRRIIHYRNYPGLAVIISRPKGP